VPAPLTHAHDKHFDLEVLGRFPLTGHLKDPLLRILVLGGRTLSALESADHVLHFQSSFIGLTSSIRLLLERANVYASG
jgi:hypothetical protein